MSTLELLTLQKNTLISVEYLYAVSENISKSYEKPSLTDAQMATFEKNFRMDIMLYELVQEKFEKQIDAFGRERMERELEKLKELQKKCEVDKSLCSRKRHVKYSDDPGKEKLSKEVNQVPIDAVRSTAPMDRDKGKLCFYDFCPILG